eukprot:scaffold5726_cov119-Skeletonema_dohrnii-CCMP3373.AAC.2
MGYYELFFASFKVLDTLWWLNVELRSSQIGSHHIIDEALLSKSIANALVCACFDMRKDKICLDY